MGDADAIAMIQRILFGGLPPSAFDVAVEVRPCPIRDEEMKAVRTGAHSAVSKDSALVDSLAT